MSGGGPKGGADFGPARGPGDLSRRIAKAVREGAGGQGKRAAAPRSTHPTGKAAGGSGAGSAGARPKLGVMTTTLWEYSSQHYDDSLGRRMQGDRAYEGATPSWVIWQVLTRYTKPGDVVLDPMAGSGTTLDVCHDLKRTAVVFDLMPSRPEIAAADARELPVDDESVDFVFVDPPYSTHIEYSNHAQCIGKLDAGEPPKGREGVMGEAYYTAMEEVIAEIHRVLRPGRFLALYVQDSFKKTAKAPRGTKAHPHAMPGVFMPIGFELFSILRDYFEPADIVCVVRQNEKLARGNWHQAAEEGNFFLRGFNYLFILRKPGDGIGR